ncbi:MAG: EAL domain-containing protein [Proteobacteria bacterium]|nr:EAL domain-containing protein [Pseudomonadota bacterium]
MSIGFARAISGPLKLLTIGAEAARHSSRHALPRVRGYREVASLAESLNALLNDRRQREEALSLARAEAERAEREANTAHARLRDAIEAVPAGVVLFDNEDRYVLWNSRYEELYSESRNMLRPGLRFEDRLRAAIALGQYPLAIGREEEWLAQRLANHHRDSSDHEQRLPGDRWVKIEERRTRDGRIGIRTDITELKRREASFRLLFDSNPLPMWVIDLESLRFIAVNSAAIAHYGYREEQFLAMTVDQLWPADDRAATRLAATRDLSSNAGRGGRHVTADGTEIHVQIFSRALTYAQRPAKIAAIIDVTERRRAEARITHMAHHDELTGLANRTLFRERLEEALARARRSGDGLAVHCIDLDNFKTVNDTLGHPIGDVLLRMVAERLLQCIRETDTVARLGGDEFAVIQDGIGDPQAAGNLAQRLIDAMSDPFAIEGHEVAASSSIGIATAIRGEEDADLLLRNADMALYRAKSAGRRTFCFFEPEMDAHLQARRKMELDLRTALARQEFEVHYQPIIDLASNRLDGFEALLRWNHPQRGPVSPAQFIPIAEEAGLIVSIGEWVLRQACNEAMTWPDDTAIAVNLSPVQFMSGNIVQAVITALAVSGLPAGRLELEITESVLFEDNDVNLATLHRLRLLGVRVALDDFGTGYSSLSVLRRFPFDKIKIDRSFVGELAHNPDCLAISQGIIALASGLGMKTTAEGVETRDQADILRAGGCDSAQGYLYGAARPGCDSRAFIASSRMAAQSAA